MLDAEEKLRFGGDATVLLILEAYPPSRPHRCLSLLSFPSQLLLSSYILLFPDHRFARLGIPIRKDSGPQRCAWEEAKVANESHTHIRKSRGGQDITPHHTHGI